MAKGKQGGVESIADTQILGQEMLRCNDLGGEGQQGKGWVPRPGKKEGTTSDGALKGESGYESTKTPTQKEYVDAL